MKKQIVVLLTGIVALLALISTVKPAETHAEDHYTSILRAGISSYPKTDETYLEYKVENGEWTTTLEEELEIGTKLAIRLKKPNGYAIGYLRYKADERNYGPVDVGGLPDWIPNVKTSDIAEGLLSKDGYVIDIEEKYRYYDLYIHVVQMPEEITLRFDNVVGTNGSALQIHTERGNVDFSVEYNEYYSPEVQYTIWARSEGCTYFGVFENAIPRMENITIR